MTYWQDFPDGRRRRKEVVSKIKLFLQSQLADAEESDIAFLPLAFSNFSFDDATFSYQAVQCVTPSSVPSSTVTQAAITPLLANRDPAQASRDVLLFLLFLSDTSQRAAALSPFIEMYVVHVFSSPARY